MGKSHEKFSPLFLQPLLRELEAKAALSLLQKLDQELGWKHLLPVRTAQFNSYLILNKLSKASRIFHLMEKELQMTFDQVLKLEEAYIKWCVISEPVGKKGVGPNERSSISATIVWDNRAICLLGLRRKYLKKKQAIIAFLCIMLQISFFMLTNSGPVAIRG